MEKINGKVLAIVGFIIVVAIGATMFYSNQSRMEREQSIRFGIKALAESKYGECKDKAYSDYDGRWETSCRALGKGEGCNLSFEISSKHDKDFLAAKAVCLDEYTVGLKY